MAEIRSETPQLIAFVDLTRFAAQSQRVDDVEIADTLDAFYEQVGASVVGQFESPARGGCAAAQSSRPTISSIDQT